MERQIIHVDMDAFYAAVEIRDNPQLKQKPVIIGGSRRGVVSTCCYRARKYGVRSAMPIYKAKELCPDGVYLPPDHDKYKKVSQEIRKIFLKYTPLVEPLSLDEAFLDVTGSLQIFGSAPTIGENIQQEIQHELKLSASLGIAINKFIAKVASDLKKPQGFTYVLPGNEKSFLAPLPIDKLWGVGKKTTKLLKGRGFHTIGDLQKTSFPAASLGITDDILQLAHGIDHREVIPEEPPKSIGQEKTFEQDLTPGKELISYLLEFSEQVGARLREAGFTAKTVTVKVRDNQFRTRTKQKSVSSIDSDSEIYYYAREILDDFSLSGTDKIRLLGVTVSNLIPKEHHQLSLNDLDEKSRKLQTTLDEMRTRYGKNIIRRARHVNFQQDQK